VIRNVIKVIVATAVYALAPVLWLFAVSTATIQMFMFLVFALVAVAVVLGRRPLRGLVKAQVTEHGSGFYVWFLIFLVVALQTVTLVRPMLASDGTITLAPRREKCFFLAHFCKTVNEDCDGSTTEP